MAVADFCTDEVRIAKTETNINVCVVSDRFEQEKIQDRPDEGGFLLPHPSPSPQKERGKIFLLPKRGEGGR